MSAASEPSAPAKSGALFHRDGDYLVPTELTQGPWDPGAQHGGPVAALLAWAVDSYPSLVPMRAVRFSFDLTKPVPIKPLQVRTDLLRDGKKVQLLDVTILHDGEPTARCRALRVRRGDSVELADHPLKPVVDAPRRMSEGGPLFPIERAADVPGYIKAIEAVRVKGGPMQGVPAITWFKLNVPVIAGEVSTPAMVLCAHADFTSGTSNYIDFLRYTSINADLTVHVVREPETDWMCVDAWSVVADDAIGQARASIYDESGLVAHTAASLIIEQRPRPLG